MCSHAFIRIWAEGAWWLACANPGCSYRIFESEPSYKVEREAPHDDRTSQDRAEAGPVPA